MNVSKAFTLPILEVMTLQRWHQLKRYLKILSTGQIQDLCCHNPLLDMDAKATLLKEPTINRFPRSVGLCELKLCWTEISFKLKMNKGAKTEIDTDLICSQKCRY